MNNSKAWMSHLYHDSTPGALRRHPKPSLPPEEADLPSLLCAIIFYVVVQVLAYHIVKQILQVIKIKTNPVKEKKTKKSQGKKVHFNPDHILAL